MVPAFRPHPSTGRQAPGSETLISNRPAADEPGPTVVAEPSTTLKWSSDGELSALDLHRIIDRLADADPVASSLTVSQFGMECR